MNFTRFIVRSEPCIFDAISQRSVCSLLAFSEVTNFISVKNIKFRGRVFSLDDG